MAVGIASTNDLTGRPITTGWLRIAYGLWIGFAIVLIVRAYCDPANHSTYPCFEAGVRCWWNGENVYRDCPHQFRYGPAFASAAGPVALLPTWLGAPLWALLNVGVTFWSLRVLSRRILPWPRDVGQIANLSYIVPISNRSHDRLEACPTRAVAQRREALYFALALIGSYHGIWSGQTNMLIFALVALGAIAVLDKRWWLAALLLAIPVHIKVWPLAAAGLLAACWPRKLAWRLPIALAGVGAIAFLLKPPGWVLQQYVDWFDHLVGPAQIRHTYYDAWTIWDLMARPVNERLYVVLQLFSAVAALVLCLWQAWQTSGERRAESLNQRLLLVVLATWTSWQLVFGPGTERNTFGLIAPLTAWGLIAAFELRCDRWLIAAGFILTLIASSGQIEQAISPYTEWIKAAHPVGIILFYVWFLRWNRTPACSRADS